MEFEENNAEELFANRFKIIKTCAGGMADVIILQDINNKRMVVAKTPYVAHEHFSRESRLWLGLGSHANIVKAHVVHQIDGMPFLFIDFIGGSSGNPMNLRTALMEASNEMDLVIKAAIGTIRALKYANSIFPGFVHRDLKPENILIDEAQNPYVTDFGIGHIPKRKLELNKIKIREIDIKIIKGSTIFTEVGSFVGTPGYASPEQYFDSSNVSFKSDIYSLGVILFEVLTGKLPFSLETIEHNGISLMNIPLKKPAKLKTELQLSLWHIISKMLAFDPVDRFESLEQVENELFNLKENYSSLELKLVNENRADKDLGRTTLSNRVHSLIELGEHQLAARTLYSFQKKYPLSQLTPVLINNLFDILPDGKNWNFLKEAAIKDVSNPLRLFLFMFLGSAILGPLCWALSRSLIQLPEFIMSILILFILAIEKYINSRTAITLDKITLSGIVAGVLLTFIFQVFNYRTVAGGTEYSIIGGILGLLIPFVVALIYHSITMEDGIGGGTIKLLAMIGSWTGLMILPIIIISSVLFGVTYFFGFLIKNYTSELTWSKGTICPKLLWIRTEMPTSTAIFISTWLVISLNSLKYNFTVY